MLSVIVPVYNVSSFLKRCLDSIALQNIEDMEVLIVDDGSTDNSSLIAQEFCKSDTRFRYIHKENGGLMSAWTLGVKESKGDYIGFVDSDDCIDPEMYTKMMGIASEYKADIVLCDYKIGENKNTNSLDIQSGFYSEEEFRNIKSLIFPVEGRPMISNSRWSKIYKRNIILDNLKYTTSLSRTFEDRYIVPAAFMSAETFYYIKEPLYIYSPDRPGCNSKKYKQNLLSDIHRFYGIQKQMLIDKGLFDEYESDWEKAFLNIIRVYTQRNIIGVKEFNKRMESSKMLLNDSITISRLEKYPDLCVSKLEKAVLLSHRIHSPLLLTLCSYLAR